MGAKNGTRANSQGQAPLFCQVRGYDFGDLFTGLGGLCADAAGCATISSKFTCSKITDSTGAVSKIARSTATGRAINDGTVDGGRE